MKQRVKLSAGRGWTSFLGGQRSRPEFQSRGDLSALNGEPLRKAADGRVRALTDAMKRADRRTAQVALNETMYLLRRAKSLPGDEARRAAMKEIVTWLHDQP